MKFTTIIRQIKRIPRPENFFLYRSNGYGFDLPDNILVFSRGGLAPLERRAAIHHRHLLNVNLGVPCFLLLNGQRIRLETGSCFLIYPYENHLFLHTDPGIFRLMITFEVKRTDILPERHSTTLLSPETLDLVSTLLKAYSRKVSPWELTLLLTLLLNKLKEESSGDRLSFGGLAPDASVSSEIAKYILAHLDRPLSLSGIAGKFHCSLSSLRRKFLSETGITPGEYIVRSRISRAMYELSRNEKSIGEIAEYCGYSSIQAFSRAFREKVEMTPLAFRRQKRLVSSPVPSGNSVFRKIPGPSGKADGGCFT